MMSKCLYRKCPNEGRPMFAGCCCKRHQTAVQRSSAAWNGKPNTSFTVLSKPAVVRKPGTDNRKVSGE